MSGDTKIGPVLDEGVETNLTDTAAKECFGLRRRSRSDSPKGLLSPKTLTPLVIPSSTGPTPQRVFNKKPSPITVDSPVDTPPNVPPKSARMLEDKFSPQSRTPFTPLSSSTYTPLSSTANISLSSTATPISASEGRISPFPAISNMRGPSPMGHSRGQSDTGSERAACTMGHRREQSEASIMDRGRPKKRTEGSPITLKRTTDKRTLLAEQKAFETLPEGIKATDAQQKWNAEEIQALKKQAVGQAAKFEVLGMKDVESLSRVCLNQIGVCLLAGIELRRLTNASCIRNSVLLTNVANTSEKHIILSDPAVATCTSVYVPIYARHARPNFPIIPS